MLRGLFNEPKASLKNPFNSTNSSRAPRPLPTESTLKSSFRPNSSFAKMPLILTDDESESDGPDAIPAKGKIPTKAEEAAAMEVDDEEDEDEEEGEEYKVETILEHRFGDGGQVLYKIKWLGYEKKADQTWEPIENLDNAMDLVNEYHDSIGGAPIQTASFKKSKSMKRSASAANLNSPAPKSSPKKSRGRMSDTNGISSSQSKLAKLPDGSWEEKIMRVHTVLEEFDDKAAKVKNKDNRILLGLIEWNDGSKTQHPLETLRRKCPQKMLDYFVQHLVFRPTDAKEDADAEAAAKEGDL